MDHSRMAGFDGGNDFFPGKVAEDLPDFRTRAGRANRLLHWRARHPAWRTLRTGVQRSTADNLPVLRVFSGAGWPRGTQNCAAASPFFRNARLKLGGGFPLRPVETLLLLCGRYIAAEAFKQDCRALLEARVVDRDVEAIALNRNVSSGSTYCRGPYPVPGLWGPVQSE